MLHQIWLDGALVLCQPFGLEGRLCVGTSSSKLAPTIAGLAEERFQRDQLVMIGTLRTDGSPRISPCEVDFAEGQLLLGMMWRSKKALDLLTDLAWSYTV
jgi:hypothetical protein